jgi:phosphopantothenoylcysteine decarboxylase/phosphopantothenate--cysteine ligase
MSARLTGRLVVLGITGSIAAFKAPEIVRALRAEGADVQVLMTPAATRFVSPLTMRTLTGRAVDADLLDLLPDGRIGHIAPKNRQHCNDQHEWQKRSDTGGKG